MSLGTVRWFSVSKGYGFITPDDGSEDLFCHYSEIAGSGRRNLEEGQRVEYRGESGTKGRLKEIKPHDDINACPNFGHHL